jgi:L-lactate dehydrogenase (cytochrome)
LSPGLGIAPSDRSQVRRAAACGADALVVSNHGGRQLDGAMSSITALPAVVAAVGNRTEVHVDGGIQSGQDVFKAIAMGAKATYVGRSMLYGLGALGKRGVTKAIELIQGARDHDGLVRHAHHRGDMADRIWS